VWEGWSPLYELLGVRLNETSSGAPKAETGGRVVSLRGEKSIAVVE